jgi:hypothetical protein
MESTDYLCQRLRDTADVNEKYFIIDQLKIRLQQLEEEKLVINKRNKKLLIKLAELQYNRLNK